jgi:predicted metal-dependent phosphoesterase TrpH
MIDLHAHSTCSDGSLSPRQLVDYAREQGLTALALTDHDMTGGLEEASARARETGLGFVPGVELEINTSSGEFHLLGLNLHLNRSALEEELITIRDHRSRRNERIISKMNEDGLPVSLDDIAALAGGRVISRLHFAAYLVNLGRAQSISDAFERFLGQGRPYFDPKKALDLPRAVELIHGAGGKAVIAHPFSLNINWEQLTQTLLVFKAEGLDGIEAHHSDYPLPDCQRLEAFGRDNGFGITAGSDFHGAAWPTRRLGHSSGGREISDSYLDWLLT